MTSYLKESWRRCELQPALDQAQALRKTMEEDQRYAEALQVENHVPGQKGVGTDVKWIYIIADIMHICIYIYSL